MSTDLVPGKPWQILHGDVRRVAKTLPPNYFHASLSDPPYGLSFMGRRWDYSVPSAMVWSEIERTLIPGAHAMYFGGPRTFHRVAIAVEDGGFELRDLMMWLFGSGYPKSHDVTKTIDKRLGVKRKQIGTHALPGRQLQAMSGGGDEDSPNLWTGIKLGGPESELAKLWKGFGSALKPGYEPIILARKMTEGTIAENVMRYGAGAIDIDGSRVGTSGGTSYTRTGPKAGLFGVGGKGEIADIGAGRWPANVILSHGAECEFVGMRPSSDVATRTQGTGTGEIVSQNVAMGGANYKRHVEKRPDEEVWRCQEDCPVRMIDEQSGESRGGVQRGERGTGGIWSPSSDKPCGPQYGDKGGASRFYYVAKADQYQRDAGLEGVVPLTKAMRYGKKGQGPLPQQTPSVPVEQRNTHPTVKPIDLIRYLAKMILPPPSDTPRRILVPFSGSGSEMIGCIQAGWDEVVGIEREAQYIEFAKARISGGGVFSGLMDKKMRRRKAAR